MFKGCTFKSLFLVVALALAIALVALPVMAQDSTPEPTATAPAATAVVDNTAGDVVPVEPPTQPIDLVVAIGLVVANGVSLVPLLNKIPWWVALPGSYKSWIVFLGLLFLPTLGDLATKAVLSLDVQTLALINREFFLLQMGFWGWAASQYGLPLFKMLKANSANTAG